MITPKMKARAALGLDVLTKHGISPIISASIKAELRSVLGSYYLHFQEISSRHKVDSRTLSKIINSATCAHCGTLTDYCSGKRSLCLRCSKTLPKADRVRYRVDSTEKTCMDKYGCRNPFQVESVKAALSATNLKRYGDVNPGGRNSILRSEMNKSLIETGASRAAAARKTNLERYGDTHPLKTKAGMRSYRALMLANHGVTNPMHKPEVKAAHARKMRILTKQGVFKLAYKKVQQTCLDLFGVDNIFKDAKFMREARLRSTGFEYPLQDPEAVKRFVSTCIARYGKPHPMQTLDVFKRTMAAAQKFNFYEFVYGSTKFNVIGTYEIFVLRYLLSKYPRTDLRSGNSVEPLNLDYRSGVYFPDFYIKSTDTFVEVKSLYTLVGCEKHRYSLLEGNRKKAKSLYLQGVRLAWVVPNPSRGTMCQLPQKWFNWDREKLVKYVADSQIDVSLLPQGRFQCHLLHTDKQPA